MADLSVVVFGGGGSQSPIQPPFDVLSRSVTSEALHITPALTPRLTPLLLQASTETLHVSDIAPAFGGFTLRNASNTGLAGAGISEGSLTNQGAITYTSANNGQTISGKRFTGKVTFSGVTGMTFNGCLWDMTGGTGNRACQMDSSVSNITFNDCTMRTIGCNSSSPSGSGIEFMILSDRADGITVTRCDISGGENCFQGFGDGNIIQDSYLHWPKSYNPGGHNDTIEVYGGDNWIIRRNTIILEDMPSSSITSPVNIAPWTSNPPNVSNCTIEENYIDGGIWTPITVDSSQSTSPPHTLTNIRIVRNRFGGHQVNADYQPCFANTYGMTRVSTDTAGSEQYYLPFTGADANYWWYCRSNAFGFSDLTPDKEGTLFQVAG